MDLLLQQNLANLHTFWSAMPHRKEHKYNVHLHWPNKAWREDFEGFQRKTIEDKTWVTTNSPSGEAGHQAKTALLAMALRLDEVRGQTDSQISVIDSAAQLTEWVQSCSNAFGYQIDKHSLAPLLHQPHATLFAYRLNQKIAGTAIAYQTHKTMGVHQMGVTDNYRGLGIAKKMMMHLVEHAKQSGCKLMTLQASNSGRALYEKIGFTALTEVYHF